MRNDHYGITWDGPIGWLRQKTGDRNAVGLNVSCPFESPQGRQCNHRIDLDLPRPSPSQWKEFLPLLQDPLVRGMCPLPRTEVGASLFEDHGDSLFPHLTTLSRLSSPIKAIVYPIWWWTERDLREELAQTNVQPLVLTQVETSGQRRLDALMKRVPYFPRALILTGSPHVILSGGLREEKTVVQQYQLADLNKLPLELLGAEVLRRYLRKEDLHAA